MSYYVEIGFAHCTSRAEAFELGLKAMSIITEQQEAIIYNNMYSLVDDPGFTAHKIIPYSKILQLGTSKFIYWEKYQLLGWFGGAADARIKDSTKVFQTVAFQDGTNQNYACWPDIPYFNQVKALQDTPEARATAIPRLEEGIPEEDIEEAILYVLRSDTYSRIEKDLEINNILYREAGPNILEFSMNAFASNHLRERAYRAFVSQHKKWTQELEELL